MVHRTWPSSLYICLGGALLVLAYIDNKTLRFDKDGIKQGFSIFSTFISYDAIGQVRKETRSSKGASSVALVIVDWASSKRIAVPLAAFDHTKLCEAFSSARSAAPHARMLVEAMQSEPVDRC